MPKPQHLTPRVAVSAAPQTEEEFFAAAKLGLARATAELAKTAATNPSHFALLDRALYHQQTIALKRSELDLMRERLHQTRRAFNRRFNQPGRLLSIEIHNPEKNNTL